MATRVSWQGAETLEECVVRYFQNVKKTPDEEADFAVLQKYFGSQRIVEIWERYQLIADAPGSAGSRLCGRSESAAPGIKD